MSHTYITSSDDYWPATTIRVLGFLCASLINTCM